VSFRTYAGSIAKKFNLTRAESKRIIQHLIEQIAQDIIEGDRVYFRGFGSFKKVKRPAKKYRNINTGKIDSAPARMDVDFGPDKTLLRKLKKP